MSVFKSRRAKLYFLILLYLCSANFNFPTAAESSETSPKVPIVLIHGIGGSDLTYKAPAKTDERKRETLFVEFGFFFACFSDLFF